MINFTDFIEQTNQAETSEKAFEFLQKALKEIGFDKVLFSLMTDHDSIGKKAGHGILRNYPEDWMNFYFEKNYTDIDPVRQYLVKTSEIFRWDDLMHRLSLDKKQILMMNQAKDADLLSGVGLGIHSANGQIIGMGFSSSEKLEITSNQLSLIKALSYQFYSVYMEKEKIGINNPLSGISLSVREKDILQWTAMGKSNGVIADILNISEHTVSFHFRTIFAKLQCNNKITAVIMAIRLGLINP